MSSDYTDMIIRMNNSEDAKKAASIMKEVASSRTPVYETEIVKFVNDIIIDGNDVKVDISYSLISETFCELIPQIMRMISRYNFGAITMDAFYTSSISGYEVEISGRVFKNGNFRMSFSEHE